MPPFAPPTEVQWSAAIAAGFRSNGATCSPDTILDILIARGNNTYPPLPADLHDYRYWCGGTDWHRMMADAEFLEGLYDCVSHLHGVRLEIARRRCRLYYAAVTELGSNFWDYREEPRRFV